MTGRRSKDKGDKEERDVAKEVRPFRCTYCGRGWAIARRQPMSGAIPGFPHDVQLVNPHGVPISVESKVRGSGFKLIYRALAGGADICNGRADHEKRFEVIGEKFRQTFWQALTDYGCQQQAYMTAPSSVGLDRTDPLTRTLKDVPPATRVIERSET